MNSTQAMTMIVNDLCDAMECMVDRANASHRAVAASPSSPSGSVPSGLPSLSQENTREPGCSNKAPGSNQ